MELAVNHVPDIQLSPNNDVICFGYGDSSVIKNPEHRYNSVGVYTVKLVATTSFGCKSETSNFITIHPDNAVFPPNAFTPNSDGANDTFKVQSQGVNYYGIRIYSRWGELIFEATDLNDEWDGTHNGNPVIYSDL